MALMAALMAGVVAVASPYTPSAHSAPPIETIWEIEDARRESDAPLVTALLNFGAPLAYDRAENTFYCSLGMREGDAWPELSLTAEHPDVTLCFTDDYEYDSCAQAIAQGYAYEMMAYTDEAYSYFSIVFTGLPIISLQAQDPIGGEDTPVAFAMNAADDGFLAGPARAHLRGDSGLIWSAKHGYRIEFTRDTDGTNKIVRTVPGFMDTDALLLLPMAFDDTLMRDRLSWEMYALLSPGEESFGARMARYCEVFVDEAYAGVYLMLEPMDIEAELAKAGGDALLTDSVYRSAVMTMEKERPMMEDVKCNGWGYEMFRTADAQEPFRPLDAFFDTWMKTDDPAFVSLAQENMDVESIVRYTLFAQAAGLADNAHNNLFLWAHEQDDGRLIYRYKPWDMDRSWGIDAGYEYDYWFLISVADRMLALDAGGARQMALDVWNDMKARGFTQKTVEALVAQYTFELNESGAALRNALRWETDNAVVDGSYILAYCAIRFPLLERVCHALAEGDTPYEFLMGDLSTDELIVRRIDLD